MKNLAPIGRVLFGIPFIIFGINHIIMLDFYMGMLTSFLEGYSFTIITTGLIMILAGVAIMTARLTKIAALVLAGLLIIFISSIHIPNLITPAEGVDTSQYVINLLKDVSLLGGSLMVAGTCKDARKEQV